MISHNIQGSRALAVLFTAMLTTTALAPLAAADGHSATASVACPSFTGTPCWVGSAGPNDFVVEFTNTGTEPLRRLQVTAPADWSVLELESGGPPGWTIWPDASLTDRQITFASGDGLAPAASVAFTVSASNPGDDGVFRWTFQAATDPMNSDRVSVGPEPPESLADHVGVDTTSPTLDLSLLGVPATGMPFTIEAEAADAHSGVASVAASLTFLLFDGSTTAATDVPLTLAGGVWSAALPAPVPPDAVRMDVAFTATDRVGNAGGASAAPDVLDVIAPTIVSHDDFFEVFPGTTITVTASATDNLEPVAGRVCFGATCHDMTRSGGDFSVTFAAPTTAGPNPFEVIVKDAAGNEGTADGVVDVTFPGFLNLLVEGPNPFNPTLTWPLGGRSAITFTLDRTVSTVAVIEDDDGDAVNTVLTGVPLGAGARRLFWDGHFNLHGQALAPDGTYNWTLDGVDAWGNAAPTGVAAVVVDTVPPGAPTPLLPAGPYVNATGVPTLFTWLPPESDIRSYRLELSQDSTFASGVKSLANLPAPAVLVGANVLDAEGAWYWRVRATDLANNVGPWSDTATFTLDTVLPVLTVDDVSPDPFSAALGDAVVLSFSLSETADVEMSVFLGEDEIAGPFSPSTGEFTWDGLDDLAAPLPDGVYSLVVTGSDLAGNPLHGGSVVVDVTLDNTAPTLELDVTPVIISEGTLTVDIVANETLGDISAVATFEDDSTADLTCASKTTPLTYRCTLEITRPDLLGLASVTPEGNATVDVSADDLAGNPTSGSVDFVVDYTAPELPSPTPVVPHFRASGIVTLCWTDVSDAASYDVAVSSDDFATSSYEASVSALLATLCTTTTPLTDAEYEFRVRAQDHATPPNVGGWSATEAFVVDTLAPSLEGEVDGSPFSAAEGGFVTVSFTVDDAPRHLGFVTVTVKDALGVEVHADSTPAAVSAGDFVWYGLDGVGDPLPDGAYDIVLTGEDQAGNAAAPVELQAVLDNTAPTLAILDVPTGPLRAGTYPVRVTSDETLASLTLTFTQHDSDAVEVDLECDTVTLECTGEFTVVASAVPGETDGTATLAANGADPAGNPATADVDVVVDTVAPDMPDILQLQVVQNRPGTADQVRGLAGSVEADALVTVYADCGADGDVLGTAIAGPDGSFALVSIGDNVHAAVSVTATDAAGNEGAPTCLANDIVGPTLTPLQADPVRFSPDASPGVQDKTFLSLVLDEGAEVTIDVVDADDTFQKRVLHRALLLAGPHTFFWDGYSVFEPESVEGEYTFVVSAFDAYGNPTWDRSVVVVVDNTPPDFVIETDPAEPVAGELTVTATSEPLVGPATICVDYEAFLDECKLAGANVDATVHSATFMVPEDTNGVLVVTVSGTDLAGNLAESDASFDVDAFAPEVSDVAHPESGETGGEAEVTARVTDDGPGQSGIDSVVLLVGGDEHVMTPDPVDGDLYAVTLSLSIDFAGELVFSIRATDVAGNLRLSGPHVIDVVDTILPTFGDLDVEIVHDGGFLQGVVSVAATATDNVGVATMELWLAGVLHESAAGSPAEFSVDTSEHPDGLTEFRVVAVDAAGNSVEDAVSYTLDNTAPTTTVTLTPESGTGADGWYLETVQVATTADDGAGAGVLSTECLLDDAPFDPDADVVDAGDHVLVCTSEDVLGNAEAATPLAVRVDLAAPAFVTEPGDATVTVGDTHTFMFEASDDVAVAEAEIVIGGVPHAMALVDGAWVLEWEVPSPSGTIEYAALVRDAAGRAARSPADETAFHVLDVEATPIGAVTLSCLQTTLKPGESTTCEASATDSDGIGVTGATFTWSGDGDFSSETGSSVTYTAPTTAGTYGISVEAAKDGATGSDGETITVTLPAVSVVGPLTVAGCGTCNSVDIKYTVDRNANTVIHIFDASNGLVRNLGSFSVVGGVEDTRNWNLRDDDGNLVARKGAIYTILVTATDVHGNVGTGTTTVQVNGN